MQLFVTICCSLLLGGESFGQRGNTCPRPTVYRFGFKLMAADSVPAGGSFNPQEVRFYAEEQRNLRMGLSTEVIGYDTVLMAERFEKHDFYTLEVCKATYKIAFELSDAPDPENSRCGIYRVDRTFIDGKEMCNNCHEQAFHYIIFKSN